MASEMEETQRQYQRVQAQLRVALIAAVAIVSVGSVFYHIVEKLRWLDSVYFCVVTLATVGYGDIVPKTDAGKLFTIGYILVGIGIIGGLVNVAIKRAVLRRELARMGKVKA